MKMETIFLCLLMILCLLRTSTSINTIDSITPSQFITDAGQTLVSAGGSYELGFFSPAAAAAGNGNVKRRYLGIWYTFSNETIVWVANREKPLVDSSGVLRVTDQGVLVLLNSSNSIIWSSNSSGTLENPITQLLDSGNLVVKDANEVNPDNFLWQSFDYPGDTRLPGSKLGWNLATGLESYVSSWTSTDDPAPGTYSLRIDLRGYPQIVIMKGTKIQTRGGSWNGQYITGYVGRRSSVADFELVSTSTQIYYEFTLHNKSIYSRYVLIPTGFAQSFVWIQHTRSWEPLFSSQADQCEIYGYCGVNARCIVNNNPVCECLKGFVPKSPKDWSSTTWSEGCIRETPLACNSTDDFSRYSNFKLPDTSSSWYNRSMNLKDCKILCLENCSCTAYANLDVRDGGSGCLLWFGNLNDMRDFTFDSQDLYVRLAASDLDPILNKKSKSNKKMLAGILVSCILFLMGMLTAGFILYKRKRKLRNQGVIRKMEDYRGGNDREDLDSPLFDLTTIANATSNFSSSNKLGEGGFGPVYKGTLIGGEEIAVKRLAKNSGQGIKEFRNEVNLIAKLQHRNLVKLLGCCIEEEEEILVYEFMPNGSLDFYIFDQGKQKTLDWPTSFRIIDGIARGLLYLHRDSRLTIIHRDLKSSNILLDNDMNPKISDFGLAKTFGGTQSEDCTKRVVGTYGYMAPEYAADGTFSMKSDVFSFGVVLLEILSRKKNRGFYHPDHSLNLTGHAWNLWNQNTPLELVDTALCDSCTISEVLRCIQVGLLCVQQAPEDRPSMSNVVLYLGSEVKLPSPKQPGFYTVLVPGSKVDYSVNTCSTMCIEPR